MAKGRAAGDLARPRSLLAVTSVVTQNPDNSADQSSTRRLGETRFDRQTFADELVEDVVQSQSLSFPETLLDLLH